MNVGLWTAARHFNSLETLRILYDAIITEMSDKTGNVLHFMAQTVNMRRVWRGGAAASLKKLASSFELARPWLKYRGADKYLVRPGRKQVNIPVRMVGISFGALPCRKKKLYDI